MKIAIIRKKFSPFGGAEIYISNFIKTLLKDGHEVHLFANSWEKNFNCNIIYHHVPMVKFTSFLKTISFAYFSRWLLKKDNYDLIFSFERTFYQDIYRAGDGCHKEWLIQKKKYSSFLDKIAIVFNPLNFALLNIEKKIFKKENYKFIIANSYRGKEEIIRNFNVPPNRISVIHNGVDLKKFNPENKILFRDNIRLSLKINKTDILVIFTGSGFKRKGLKFLLEAIHLVKIKNNNIPIKLIIAGKGPIYKYKKISKNLGIKDNVIFLGPYKNIKFLYAAADLFVLPSLYEPFSNACCEAMASGLPIIISKINGVSELINEDVNGYLINEPINSNKIANSIIRLLDEEKRIEISNNARRTIEKYPIEHQNSQIVNLLIDKTLLKQ